MHLEGRELGLESCSSSPGADIVKLKTIDFGRCAEERSELCERQMSEDSWCNGARGTSREDVRKNGLMAG